MGVSAKIAFLRPVPTYASNWPRPLAPPITRHSRFIPHLAGAKPESGLFRDCGIVRVRRYCDVVQLL
jgi:hypothetical protein